jgi:hypothetical protein
VILVTVTVPTASLQDSGVSVWRSQAAGVCRVSRASTIGNRVTSVRPSPMWGQGWRALLGLSRPRAHLTPILAQSPAEPTSIPGLLSPNHVKTPQNVTHVQEPLGSFQNGAGACVVVTVVTGATSRMGCEAPSPPAYLALVSALSLSSPGRHLAICLTW